MERLGGAPSGAKVGLPGMACGPLAPCHVHVSPMCMCTKFGHVWSFASSIFGLCWIGSHCPGFTRALCDPMQRTRLAMGSWVSIEALDQVWWPLDTSPGRPAPPYVQIEPNLSSDLSEAITLSFGLRIGWIKTQFCVSQRDLRHGVVRMVIWWSVFTPFCTIFAIILYIQIILQVQVELGKLTKNPTQVMVVFYCYSCLCININQNSCAMWIEGEQEGGSRTWSWTWRRKWSTWWRC
jgi:hypothetical protein